MENETKMFWLWTALIVFLSTLMGLAIHFGNPFSGNLVLGWLFWFLGVGVGLANLAAVMHAYVGKPYLFHMMDKLS